MNVTAMAAVGPNWELGFKGDLIYRNSDDLMMFKAFTMGKVVVVGRKTYESMPPLKGRTVICLTRSKSVQPKQDGDLILRTRRGGKSPWPQIKKIAERAGQDVVVAGGAEIYALMAQNVTSLLLTLFSDGATYADTYFPKDAYSELLAFNSSKYIWGDQSDEIYATQLFEKGLTTQRATELLQPIYF